MGDYADPVAIISLQKREAFDLHKKESGFEGAEKRLEIDLKPVDGKSMRRTDAAFWPGVMKLIGAEIIDIIRNNDVDSYLLSESSLFVHDSRITLITCGQTVLLDGLETIIAEVKKLGMEIEWLSFSRKDFLYPWEQKSSHKSVSTEYTVLKKNFPEGQVFFLGPVDGDHYLYFVYDNVERPARQETDQQLNLIMYDLAEDVARNFYADVNGLDTKILREKSGIEELVKGMKVQDKAFEKCGYSMNCIPETSGIEYSTIHVTPENHCSYASFETIQKLDSYKPLIQQVLGVFRPKKFTLITLLDSNSIGGIVATNGVQDIGLGECEGYARVNFTMNEFRPGYRTYKANFEKR